VALGRDNVVHLALIDRGAATRVASLLQRLLHFQGQAGLDAASMDDDNGQAHAAPATIPDHGRVQAN
jgi:hypothetical protein